jgi:uncharacterized delta-60 repeat protein
MLVKLTPTGTLDQTFGADGIVPLALGGYLAVGQDDRAVIAAGGPQGTAFARYQADGKPDTAFGTDGIENVSLDVAGIKIDNRNRILAFGSWGSLVEVPASGGATPDGPIVVRLSASGSLDSSFDDRAQRAIAGCYVGDVAPLPDGTTAVLTACSQHSSRLGRLLPNGALDRSFGARGWSSTPVWGTLASEPDRVLVVGAFNYGDGYSQYAVSAFWL